MKWRQRLWEKMRGVSDEDLCNCSCCEYRDRFNLKKKVKKIIKNRALKKRCARWQKELEKREKEIKVREEEMKGFVALYCKEGTE